MRNLTLLGLVLTLSLLILATTDKASADPGISVTITAIDPFIVALNDIATYTVTAESITTEEEYVRLTVTGDPTISLTTPVSTFSIRDCAGFWGLRVFPC